MIAGVDSVLYGAETSAQIRNVLIPKSDSDKVCITVCNTCLDTSKSGDAGIGAGETLLRLLMEQHDTHPNRDVMLVRGLRCLMSCSEGCAVCIASRGKMKYLLGRLSATDENVEQLLDFAAMYANAPLGVTPNHDWPPLINQQFLGRIPPTDLTGECWNEFGADL